MNEGYSPQLGLSLHKIGMRCCDRGCLAQVEKGIKSTHCVNVVSVKEKKEQEKPPENKYLVEPECST